MELIKQMISHCKMDSVTKVILKGNLITIQKSRFIFLLANFRIKFPYQSYPIYNLNTKIDDKRIVMIIRRDK